MATGRNPPRFVPTLTDVVGEVAPPLPIQPPLAPLATPPGEGARLGTPAIESAAALTPELQAAIAERVQALLQERLRRTVDIELQNLAPLVREAVRQVLARH